MSKEFISEFDFSYIIIEYLLYFATAPTPLPRFNWWLVPCRLFKIVTSTYSQSLKIFKLTLYYFECFISSICQIHDIMYLYVFYW
jgi:hypothetical protein